MIFWLCYIITSILLSYLISKSKSMRNYSFEIFFITFNNFYHTTSIDLSRLNYAPALFTFIFNLVFEQDFSTRVLRPLMLTIPLSLFFIVLYLIFKRRFS